MIEISNREAKVEGDVKNIFTKFSFWERGKINQNLSIAAILEGCIRWTNRFLLCHEPGKEGEPGGSWVRERDITSNPKYKNNPNNGTAMVAF